MKIAFFSDGIQPFVIGGIQRHSFYFCKFMAQMGVQIDLYHTTNDDLTPDLKTIFSEAELTNIKEFFIPFPKHRKTPGHYVRESYQYSKLVYENFKKNSDVDFVYSKNYTSWKFLEEKNNGVELPPIGTMLHGYEVHQLKSKGIRPIMNTYFHKHPTDFNTIHPDFVFSYGGKITDIIKNIGVPDSKIIEIPSGIDSNWVEDYETRTNDKIKFCFLGRYAPRKGITLIYDWLSDKLNSDKFEIQFIGPIPEDKRLKGKSVFYHGGIADSDKIKSILSKSDILLCPSRSEGMPNVILEGMSRGCAILATDVGAVSMIVDESNGWLLKPFDYTQFENCMNNIVNNVKRDELEIKGKTSQQKILNEFTWEKIAQKTKTAIENSIK